MHHLTLFGLLSLFIFIAVLVNAREEKRPPHWRVWPVVGFGLAVELAVHFLGFAKWDSSTTELVSSVVVLLLCLMTMSALLGWCITGMNQAGRPLRLGKRHRWVVALFIVLGLINVALMVG